MLHVVDEIVDYIWGRCVPDRRDAIEAHLRDCAECATDYSWAIGAIADLAERGAPHIRADRLVDISLGSKASRDEERHLDNCAMCTDDLRQERSIPIPDGVALWDQRLGFEEFPPCQQVGFVATFQSSQTSRWSPEIRVELISLANPPKLDVRSKSWLPDQNESAESWQRGADLYLQGDYFAAAVEFEEATQFEPAAFGPELLRGSALLLSRQPHAAIGHLTKAGNLARSPDELEEAMWMLGQAYLMTGNPVGAQQAFRHIALRKGRRAGEAEATLRKLVEYTADA